MIGEVLGGGVFDLMHDAWTWLGRLLVATVVALPILFAVWLVVAARIRARWDG